MTHRNYHAKFDKKLGLIRVVSYGGGEPRTATIEYDSQENRTLYGLSMEEVRDLHYALGRLLDFTS